MRDERIESAGQECGRLRLRYAALERMITNSPDLRETLAVTADAVAAALEAEQVCFQIAGQQHPIASRPPRIPAADTARTSTFPLLHDGATIGTLRITLRPERPHLAPDDLDFINLIAGHASMAVVRAQRDADAQRRIARAEALREVGRALSAELDFSRFLAVAQEQVSKIVDHDSCWLALWDEDADELDCPFYMDEGERRPWNERRLKRGVGLAWALIDERRTLNTPDYLDECRRRGLQATGRDETPRTETNPWLGTPLMVRGRLIGLFSVQRCGEPFSVEEAETLEVLAGQIAATLENARLYAEARILASCDPLTGLANHRTLHERIDAELARAAHNGQPLAAIMADLDNFKLFNDTYGHPVGDQVLRLIAEVLRSEARATDLVGRYGGDEFLVVLPGEDAIGALAYVERVRERIMRHHPSLGETSAIPLALSSGIAVYPHDARQRNDLIALADSALYASKRGGGRTVITAGGHAATLDLTAHTGFGVVEGLVLAVDAKDHYTVAHSAVVADAAVLLGEALGLPGRDLAILRTAGLLHDVGKISIPDRILRKPGQLSKDEWEVMRQHVEFGELIILGVPSLRDILEPVMHHHERWDGGGYPRGLAGEAVPLLGRIMVLADAFSAMTLDRPYRRGLPLHDALAQLRAGAGQQFDPALVAPFCDAIAPVALEQIVSVASHA